MTEMHGFKPGDIVAYVRGDAIDIGCVKSLSDRGAFVAYHLGDTCSLTPYGSLRHVGNQYAILGIVRRSQQLGVEFSELTEGCEDWSSI